MVAVQLSRLAAGKVDTRDMVHTSDFHLFPIIIMLSLFIFKKYFTGKYQSFKESCEIKKMNLLNVKISLKTKKMENISKTYNFDNKFLLWILVIVISFFLFFYQKLYIVHNAGIVYFTLFHLKTVPL